MKFTRIILCILAFFSGAAFAGVEEEVRATFDRFVAAQNAHDLAAVEGLLYDAPGFLWISRGNPVWGRDASIKRFEGLYQGTWKLSPESSSLKVMVLSDAAAQLFVPIVFTIGGPGQSAADSLFLMNQTLVKTRDGWKIASILPIPGPPIAPIPK